MEPVLKSNVVELLPKDGDGEEASPEITTCSDCLFYQPLRGFFGRAPGRGYCRKYPPLHLRFFPKVRGAVDWCGEWELQE